MQQKFSPLHCGGSSYRLPIGGFPYSDFKCPRSPSALLLNPWKYITKRGLETHHKCAFSDLNWPCFCSAALAVFIPLIVEKNNKMDEFPPTKYKHVQ